MNLVAMRESLRLDVDGDTGLAVVTLTQPARGNPIDAAFIADLKSAVLALWDGRPLRGVLLRAQGANFSFGGDIKSFHPARLDMAPLVLGWTADLHMALQRLWALPVPLVAEVQGHAMGGALSLVAGCDVVVAGRGARFGSAFTRLGLSCDSGSTATLTLRMGMARARRFVLLAELLDAEAALAAGLVDRVVDDAGLSDEALTVARQLASGPTLAYGEIKRLFIRAGAVQLQSQLEEEALAIARVARSADAQEGIAAMFEKRAPVFDGR